MKKKPLNSFQITCRRFLCCLIPFPKLRKKRREKWLRKEKETSQETEIPEVLVKGNDSFHFLYHCDSPARLNILLTCLNEEELNSALPLFVLANNLSQKNGIPLRVACLDWNEPEYLSAWRLLKKGINCHWEFYCCSPCFLNKKSFYLETGNHDVFLTTSAELFQQLYHSRLPAKIVYLARSDEDVRVLLEEKSLFDFHAAHKDCILFIPRESMFILEKWKITFPQNFSILPFAENSNIPFDWNDEGEQRLTGTAF